MLPTLMYALETWNRSKLSRINAVESSHLRGACGLIRWSGESNECTRGVVCGRGPLVLIVEMVWTCEENRMWRVQRESL